MAQEAFQAAQVGQGPPFRAGRQIGVGAVLFAHRDRLDEQSGVGDQPFAQGSLRALVMLEPALEFPGGQRRRLQGSE